MSTRALLVAATLIAVLAAGLPAAAQPAAAAEAAAGSLLGVVKSAGGDGLAGVRIEASTQAYDGTATVVASATSGDGGTYGLDLDPGRYLVTATPPADDPDLHASSFSWTSVPISGTRTLDIALEVSNVRGVVHHSDGTPAPGVQVLGARAGYSVSENAVPRTYGDGSFRLAIDASDTASTSVNVGAIPRADGNPLFDVPGRTTALIPAGGVASDVVVELRQPNVVGTLTAPDGTTTVAGSDVTIKIANGSEVFASATTSAGDGTYGFFVAPGSYVVSASSPPTNPEHWVPNSSASFTVLDTTTADAPAVQNVQLRAATLRAVVRTPAGDPVPMGHVFVNNSPGPVWEDQIADDQGRVGFDVPTGTYRYTVYTPVDTADYADVSGELTVATPDEVHDLRFRATNVRGRVLSPDGVPQFGLNVSATRTDGGAIDPYDGGTYAYTTTSGTYGLVLPAGQWRVTVPQPDENPAGWGSGSIDITVGDTTLLDQDITMVQLPPRLYDHELLADNFDDWTLESSIGSGVSADGTTAVASVVFAGPVLSDGGGCSECGPQRDTIRTLAFRDVSSGTVELFKLPNGEYPDGSFYGQPALSADGSRVAFRAELYNVFAADSPEADLNGREMVFVYDRTSEVLTPIPMLVETGEGIDPNIEDRYLLDEDRLSLSDDGSKLVFATEWQDTNPDVYDWLAALELVELDGAGQIVSRRDVAQANSIAAPSLSGDATTVAWSQYEKATGWTAEVRDVDAAEPPADASRPMVLDGTSCVGCDRWYRDDIVPPSLDQDGSTMAYTSIAIEQVDGYNRLITRLRVVDRDTGVDEHVTLFAGGEPQPDGITGVDVTADGSQLVVAAPGPLGESDTEQVWLHDRTDGETTIVSEGPDRHRATYGIRTAEASADASVIVFTGRPLNLIDGASESSYASAPIVSTLMESTPPEWPEGSALTAGSGAVGTTSVRLSWTAATDNRAVTRYRVYRDGEQTADVPASTRTALIQGLTPDTDYTFKVEAVDAAGNESTTGPTLAVRTLPSDTTELLPLTGTSSAGGKVVLTWDAPPAGSVTSLVVRRTVGTAVAEDIGLAANATSYTFNGLAAATNQTFQVLANTTAGQRPYTEATTVAIPALTLSLADWSADLVRPGLARLGGTVRLVARGEAGRLVTAGVAYKSWFDQDNALQPAPVDRTSTVSLVEDPQAPGTYRGTFTIAEGTAAISDVVAEIADGHGATATFDATRPAVDVSATLRMVVDAPADSLTDSLLQASSASASLALSTAITGGATVVREEIAAAGDVVVRVLDAARRVSAEQTDVALPAGRITTVTLTPKLPASLRVTLTSADKPLAGKRVEITTDGGKTWLDGDVLDADGRATFDRLQAGMDVEVRVLSEPQDLLRPFTTHVVLDAGANDEAFAVAGVDRATLSGHVRYDNGDPTTTATLTLVQQVDGYSHTFTAKTDAEGAYSINALPGAGTLSAVAGEPRWQDAVTIAPEGTTQDVTLYGKRTYDVALRLFVRSPGDVAERLIALDWRTAVHYGFNLTLDGQYLSFYNFEVDGDGVSHAPVVGLPGQTLKMCIQGTEARVLPTCATKVLTASDTDTIEMHAGPGTFATAAVVDPAGNPVTSTQSQLFRITDAGRQPAGYVYNSGAGTRILVPSPGDYVLDVTYGNQRGSATFAVPADAGGDIALDPIVMRTASFFADGENQVLAARANVLPGGDIEMRASWHNTSTAVTGLTAVIAVPAGTELVADSVMVGTAPVATPAVAEGKAELSLGNLVGDGRGSLRYRLRVLDQSATRVIGDVTMRFTGGGTLREEPLRPASVPVLALSLDAARTVESLVVPLSGRAPAGAVVTLLDDAMVVGQATAGGGGFWRTTVTLPDLGIFRPDHRIVARTTVGAGVVEVEKAVTVDASRPVVESVSMFQRDPAFGNGRRFTFDPREGVAAFPFVFVPNQTTVIEATFSDPDLVPRANVIVSGLNVPMVRGADGVFRSEMNVYSLQGPIYIESESLAKPIDLTQPGPTEEQVRAQAPWYLQGFEITDVDEPVDGDESDLIVAAGVRSAAAATDIRTGGFTTSLPGLEADSIKVTMTVSKETYTPTQSDLDSVAATGAQAWGVSAGAIGNSGFKVSMLIPLDELEGATRSGASAKSAPTSGRTSAGIEVGVARVGFEWAFTGATSLDSLLSAIGAGDKYDKLSKAIDAATECGASAGKYIDRAESLAFQAAAADVTGSLFSIGSLVLGPATFGLGTLALGVAGVLLDKALGYYIDSQTDALMKDIAADADCKKDDEDDDDRDDDDRDDDDSPRDPQRPRKRKVADPTWIYDPSGYLYEGSTSERVEGVTARLLTGPTAEGPWTEWDAEWFGQENPLVSDHEGRYGWDVPEGWWKVAYTKDGYAPTFSEALKVLPPQLDVNIGMVADGLPDVARVSLVDGAVEVAFNRLVRTASVLAGGVVSVGSASGSVAAPLPVDDPSGIEVARVFRFTPDAPLAPGSYEVKVVGSVVDYAGRVMAGDVTRTVTVAAPVDPGPGPGGPTDPGPVDPGAPATGGYRMVASDGGVFTYGGATYAGSTGGMRLNQPVVAMADTPSGAGYWLVAADGGVFSFGDARFFGSTGAMKLNKPIVSAMATPSGKGYWLVASDGGVFSFGDAKFFGSTGATELNRPIVSAMATPSGNGYWLVASDGGVFSFGDARFFGSTGAMKLNKPIVSAAPAPTGNGYWLVASDGGVFTFGAAPYAGSSGATKLNQPIVAVAVPATGTGYWLIAADGGVFSFGVPFLGSAGGTRLAAPIVGAAG